jgi:DNA repair exonuclease SbcCD nuclease subunit
LKQGLIGSYRLVADNSSFRASGQENKLSGNSGCMGQSILRVDALKFIHAADIHLDSPLKGLERYEGAPVEEIRLAARHALRNMIDLALEAKVDFVLIAGDLYDGDWREFNTGIFFIEQAKRLRDASIPLFVIAGNHDAANKMTKSLRLPDNMHLFSSEVAETKILEKIGVAIHGQSFATAAVYANLALGYPSAIPGLFNIGLLHSSMTGREGHEPYAPCTVEDLKSKAYDYWALGHIHIRETLNESPFIGFSGNIQGRHIRETGPKGCLMIEADGSKPLKIDFCELDVLRWHVQVIDIDNCSGLDDVYLQVDDALESIIATQPDKRHAVRLEFVGRSLAHNKLAAGKEVFMHEVRLRASDIGSGRVWIEKIRLSSRAPRDERLDSDDGAVGELQSVLAEFRSGKISSDVYDLSDIKKLPNELKDYFRQLKQDELQRIADHAEAILMNRLLSTEDDQ